MGNCKVCIAGLVGLFIGACGAAVAYAQLCPPPPPLGFTKDSFNQSDRLKLDKIYRMVRSALWDKLRPDEQQLLLKQDSQENQ